MQIVAGKAVRIAHFDRVVCLRRRDRAHSEYRPVAVISFQSFLGVGRLVIRIAIGRHRRGSKDSEDSSEPKLINAVHLPYPGNVVPRGGGRFRSFHRRGDGAAPGVDAGLIGLAFHGRRRAVEAIGLALADGRQTLVLFCVA